MISARLERWRAVDDILRSPLVRNNLVGDSSVWVALLRQVVEVARFTDSSILLLGETGTGKELLARLIHTLSPQRSEHELVVLDCTTIVPELAGSELFGHERGAFTGANGFKLRYGAALSRAAIPQMRDVPPCPRSPIAQQSCCGTMHDRGRPQHLPTSSSPPD
jgi:transcriptional regulator of acetoin/glycerol metabolism